MLSCGIADPDIGGQRHVAAASAVTSERKFSRTGISTLGAKTVRDIHGSFKLIVLSRLFMRRTHLQVSTPRASVAISATELGASLDPHAEANHLSVTPLGAKPGEMRGTDRGRYGGPRDPLAVPPANHHRTRLLVIRARHGTAFASQPSCRLPCLADENDPEPGNAYSCSPPRTSNSYRLPNAMA
jgi:hypothetical protein